VGTQPNSINSKPSASPVGEIGSEIGEKASPLGESILSLLRAASDRLETETQQSLGAAHDLSRELQAAKDRIEKLEDEVQVYRKKAERAQGWLDKIASEIEDRLLNRPEAKERLQ
jgi:predicted ribosome quality control (RQC) complex YloA/Tae2 family protein